MELTWVLVRTWLAMRFKKVWSIQRTQRRCGIVLHAVKFRGKCALWFCNFKALSLFYIKIPSIQNVPNYCPASEHDVRKCGEPWRVDSYYDKPSVFQSKQFQVPKESAYSHWRFWLIFPGKIMFLKVGIYF